MAPNRSWFSVSSVVLAAGAHAILRRMGVAKALDQLPRPTASAAERLRQALAMFEEGVALQRLNFQRKHRLLTEQELDTMIDKWLVREEEAS